MFVCKNPYNSLCVTFASQILGVCMDYIFGMEYSFLTKQLAHDRRTVNFPFSNINKEEKDSIL